MTKKKIEFGSIENQGDDFLRYSRGLSFSERLLYMQELRKRAWGEKYFKNALKDSNRKNIIFIGSEPEESIEDFFKRVDKIKSQ